MYCVVSDPGKVFWLFICTLGLIEHHFSDLEKALLMVPFGYVMELLGYLTDCMDDNYEMELVMRCSFFLLR